MADDAAKSRERAEKYRRLARSIGDNATAQRLLQLAAEEAEKASRLEAEEPKVGRSVPAAKPSEGN